MELWQKRTRTLEARKLSRGTHLDFPGILAERELLVAVEFIPRIGMAKSDARRGATVEPQDKTRISRRSATPDFLY